MRTVCLRNHSGGEGPRCKECSVFAPRVHNLCPGVLATSPSRVWARCRGQFKKRMSSEAACNANSAGEADDVSPSGRR